MTFWQRHFVVYGSAGGMGKKKTRREGGFLRVLLDPGLRQNVT
jgi:hypothetical protein